VGALRVVPLEPRLLRRRAELPGCRDPDGAKYGTQSPLIGRYAEAVCTGAGEVHVGHDVREEREEPIAELVAEEERAAGLAAGEAGAEDRVGALLLEDLHDAEDVARVVLEVRVVDDRDRAGRLRERRLDRCALAAVAGVLEEDPPDPPLRAATALDRIGRLSALTRRGRDRGGERNAAVRSERAGAPPQSRRVRSRPRRRPGRDEVLLVEDGDEDGEGGHGGVLAAPVVSIRNVPAGPYHRGEPVLRRRAAAAHFALVRRGRLLRRGRSALQRAVPRVE
jgi:hypothetical protein